MVKEDTKKSAQDLKSSKAGSLALTQIRLRTRKATDVVILLNEGQQGSQIVGLMVSGKACDEEELII